MQVVFKKKYWCVNPVKLADAVKVAGDNEDLVLAEYDKRAGLIKDFNTGERIEHGIFWDFEKGKAKGKAKGKK